MQANHASVHQVSQTVLVLWSEMNVNFRRQVRIILDAIHIFKNEYKDIFGIWINKLCFDEGESTSRASRHEASTVKPEYLPLHWWDVSTKQFVIEPPYISSVYDTPYRHLFPQYLYQYIKMLPSLFYCEFLESHAWNSTGFMC